MIVPLPATLKSVCRIGKRAVSCAAEIRAETKRPLQEQEHRDRSDSAALFPDGAACTPGVVESDTIAQMKRDASRNTCGKKIETVEDKRRNDAALTCAPDKFRPERRMSNCPCTTGNSVDHSFFIRSPPLSPRKRRHGQHVQRKRNGFATVRNSS